MIDRHDTRSFLEDYLYLLKKGISFLMRRVRNNIIPILLLTIFFAGLGAAYWYKTKPYYESDLVCGYNNQRFNRKNFGEMAQKLNLLAQSGSRNELASLVHITPEQAATIISIEAKNRAGSPLYEDITGEYQPLYFTVRTTNNTVFAPLQAGMVAYLNNTPYLSDIGAIQIAKIAKRIEYLEGDLRKVDSITDAYTYAIRNGSALNDSVVTRFSVTEVLNYKDQLEEKITTLQQRKALEGGATVMVMHGFAPPDTPTRGSKKIIAGCALLGLLAGLCWAILRDNKQRANA